jgi:LysR family transcriptional regulator, chromosome initiation inhibitor
MMPDLQLGQLPPGALQPLTRSAHLDVPLYWQQWRLTSAGLDRVAAAVADAAQVLDRNTSTGHQASG